MKLKRAIPKLYTASGKEITRGSWLDLIKTGEVEVRWLTIGKIEQQFDSEIELSIAAGAEEIIYNDDGSITLKGLVLDRNGLNHSNITL